MQITQNYFEKYIEVWRYIFFHRLKWDPQKEKNILEIGCFEGAATCWMLKNLLKNENSNIVCVDTFEGSEEHESMGSQFIQSVKKRFFENIKETGRSESVRVINKVSDIALLDLIHEDSFKFDFIYIDGSHAAEDVLSDLVLSFRLLKLNGLCICDDYTWSPDMLDYNLHQSPKMAIDAFTSINAKKIIFIPIPNTQFAFVRKP